MKVLYDYQILILQKYGGISRYYYDLISEIRRQELAAVDIKVVLSQNRYFEPFFNRKAVENLNLPKAVFAHVLNRIYTRICVQKYDIVHPTYYHPYITKCHKKKMVITVYDMIHELFPKDVGARDPKTIKRKKEMLYKSDHIIAISESTKKDILKIYPDIPEEKISVIYIGCNFSVDDKKLRDVKVDLPAQYILFVGGREGYKNFKFFIKAMEKILKSNKQLHVICAGGAEFTEEEKKLMSDCEEQYRHMKIDDATLTYLYAHAKCFVFPSQYEGFGIPTLEAFACECPVILSNTSSFPEVGGDAALYFEPDDMEGMRECINRVMGDMVLRDEMIKRGKAQLNKFRWDEIARQTVACYQRVLAENE